MEARVDQLPAPAARRGSRARTAALAFALIGVVVAAPSGCTVHNARKDVASPVSLPERWSSATGERAPGSRWWIDLGDDRLTAVIERALAGNFDLLRTWARFDQARAIADQAGAAASPQVSLEAGLAANRQTLFAGGKIGELSFTTTTFPLSIGASYEVDLWGRVAAQRAAAARDVEASRQDLAAAAMSVAAQVGDLWFQICEQRGLRRLNEDQLTLVRTYLGLVENRFAQGLASSVDVLQQRQQIGALLAQVPQIDSRTEVLVQQLALLIGVAPDAAFQRELVADACETLPTPPPLPDAGVPAKLLDMRPDVRAARLRVLAADERIGAAIADRFPALRLSGRTGFQGRDNVSTIFNTWVWSLAANAIAPLVDGGRRKAEVRRSKAAVREQLASYAQVILRAIGEVEAAIAQERGVSRHVAAIDDQITLAKATLGEARNRFAQGASDYLPVLIALQSVQNLERGRLASSRARLTYRIQLCRALGGTWTDDMARPPGAQADAQDDESDARADGSEDDGSQNKNADPASGDRP